MSKVLTYHNNSRASMKNALASGPLLKKTNGVGFPSVCGAPIVERSN